jgi:hypothetical protein
MAFILFTMANSYEKQRLSTEASFRCRLLESWRLTPFLYQYIPSHDPAHRGASSRDVTPAERGAAPAGVGERCPAHSGGAGAPPGGH